MKRNRVVYLFVLAALVGLSACSRPTSSATWQAKPDAQPQYGSDLDIGTVYYTLSAMSWDPADWAWKSNHDAGSVREQLFAADLSKARRNGGPHAFTADAFIPPEAMRGELAESWEWEDPLTLVVRLRPGIRWPEKPGVMAERDLTAEDVAFTFNYTNQSQKMPLGSYDHIRSVEARDDHTAVFRLNFFDSDWAYRFGYGYYSSIVPKELANTNAKDWRTVTGTGPFTIGDYVPGHRQTFLRRPGYWGREEIAGQTYALPFVDRINYRIIKDEATLLTALRTGKLDILESVRWLMVDTLKQSTPELQWNRWLMPQGTVIALRTDTPPFDDPKVRRALNIAINKTEIVERYYGGDAELMAFPQHPDFGAYFQPLAEMPASVRELFTYDPDKARRLLSEAGHPQGLAFEVEVCTCALDAMELLPLIVSYWEKIGVKATIKPMEYAAFLADMSDKTLSSAYMMNTGHVNPTGSLRKNFGTGQLWNPARYSDLAFDEKISRLQRLRDDAERVALTREMTTEILDAAPYVWLPTPYAYTAWWPWVRNYGGELRAGAVRPGPIYARIWIDQDMKRAMGFE